MTTVAILDYGSGNLRSAERAVASTGVHVVVTADPQVAASADLLVLPGTRATVADLAWLRARGLADAVAARHAAGRPTLGLCGGYQMLARTIDDDVESGAGRVSGLGLLPVDVTCGPKVLGRPTHTWRGLDVAGYEIHHGRVTVHDDEEFLGGARRGRVFGTMWHGSLESDAFRSAFLGEVAHGSDGERAPSGVSFAAARETRLDLLADLAEEHLDLDALLELARNGAPEMPVLPPGATR